ncbi:ATP synthase subunit O, mitochondrial [Harmonia axyridis]|uniref:ATP synthase subunit O, mitochondrial n=1 Tax=Harmonia axyridis TaxID=115357 RepID=UPI001E276585|nr:ATP synthase subunit O, mitochondrial [Harmonia axyridis]
MASSKLGLIVRNFSSSSSLNQMVKPPIQIFGTEGRYATALYSAATKQKALPAVEKDLTKLQDALKNEPKFKEFVLNPIIERNVKADIVKAISKDISLAPQSSILLQVLAENGHMKNLGGVINAFKTIMAAHRGEVTCEVVTAKALDASQKSKLEGVLKSFVKPNETIHLTAKVDPSIIGGMIVSIGDRYADMSVARKLKKYTDLISATV